MVLSQQGSVPGTVPDAADRQPSGSETRLISYCRERLGMAPSEVERLLREITVPETAGEAARRCAALGEALGSERQRDRFLDLVDAALKPLLA